MKLVTAQQVMIDADGVVLPGELALPDAPRGIVLFAHGSGSSRHSPRNRLVASMLHDADIGTLLFDLLTPEEDIGLTRRFDIALLRDRLSAATESIERLAGQRDLRVGYFGASTGAAAAVRAAVATPAHRRINAVVSRGGRVDLAGHDALCRLASPLLMIVGENDPVVVSLNARAAAWIPCEKRLQVIPGATHLFEEPGALEQVGKLAAGWFVRHFAAAESKRKT
ncbi:MULTISPECIES: dienelactone hydrolase family protein [Cupriavidus]|uniref:Dienelactone hydrolase n=1 Tax=Cupriavidus pinatubonensis (strain JMP 134 / LMG 1197) TaxID=264198 RepID=Q46QP6_CUPPJ|nr:MULTISPECIES: alpha/beta hydrolase [Cupriavidus]QYY27823.1 alpha/beta hydrolase [Cupriavidus pinatubonensis]TPQ35394.1 alpha/beta hydrolase [Cupriavidus pinatubonensis]